MSMRLWTRGDLSPALILVFIICLSSRASAQQFDLSIQAIPDSSRVIIEGRGSSRAQWSFVDSYGSALGLGNRIEKFQLFDAAGGVIQVRRLAPGQFESEKAAAHFKYEVNLSPPLMASEAAMVSWLTRERGLLVLADLLPLSSNGDDPVPASVRFEVPKAYTVSPQPATGTTAPFVISDVTRAVFAVGSRLRTSHVTESATNFELIADGEWAFTDDDVLDLVRQVLRTDRRVFGDMPAKNASLILVPFPQTVSATQWAAETRGSNVTLLIGKLPSKVAALAQLSTPLTHELFHLWVPNSLALRGDYDWFYEGFTMYEAARVAVSLNLLTFPQFLSAIAHAYDVYLKDASRDRWSLVEASRRRFTGGSSSVYSKSMIVALLLDLKLRESGGKHGLDDMYQKLFASYRISQAPSNLPVDLTDGNDVVAALLQSGGATQDPSAASISGAVPIDLTKELAPYGLSVEKFGSGTRVAVADRLTKRQRDLLRDLGYNPATHSVR